MTLRPAMMRDPAPGEPVGRRLAKLLAAQHGVFTRAQALEAGATPRVVERRLATRRWERLYPRVFRIAGGVSTWHQSLAAAVLAWGPGTLASHRAAGPLWRLAGIEAPILEVTVPRGRRRAGVDGVVVHWMSRVPAVDRGSVDGIPVTAPAHTLIDLAAVLPPDAVEGALDDALRRRLTTVRRIRHRLEQLGPRSGVTVMRALLDARDGSADVPESVFETRLLRVLRVGGLPRPVLQHEIRAGRRQLRIDFAYPDELVAIEAESFRWHGGRAPWQRDLERRNVLTALGWRVVHATWRDLTHGSEQLVARITSLLGAP